MAFSELVYPRKSTGYDLRIHHGAVEVIHDGKRFAILLAAHLQIAVRENDIRDIAHFADFQTASQAAAEMNCVRCGTFNMRRSNRRDRWAWKSGSEPFAVTAVRV